MMIQMILSPFVVVNFEHINKFINPRCISKTMTGRLNLFYLVVDWLQMAQNSNIFNINY